MNRLVRMVGVSCSAIALAAAATPAWSHGTRIAGVVVSITADELEIAVVDEKTHVETHLLFGLDRRTRVRRDAASLHCADGGLRPGEQVWVTTSTAVDEPLATYIYVVKR